MSGEYTEDGTDETIFEEADEAYRCLKEKLAGSESEQMTESDLERLVDEEGREVMRCLLQSAIDLRNGGDIPEEDSVVGDDGVERTHRIDSERMVKTSFGTVFSRRRGHGMRGVETLFVQDGHLNLPESRVYSHEVQRQLVRQVARTSFEASIDTLDATRGVEVPKRQAEELVVEAMRDVETFYEMRGGPVDCEEEETIQVMSFDEAGIPMLDEGLREETREAKEQDESDETRKRQAMTAALYTVAPHRRDAASIVEGLAGTSEGTSRPEPRNKRVWASLRRPSREVMEEAFEEALLRDPDQEMTWVALVDGDPKLARRVREMAADHEVDVVVVIDIIHLLEYLRNAGDALYPDDSETAEEWVQERLRRVLIGRTAGVARGMRQSATKREFSERRRAPIDKCADYIQRRLEAMDYERCLDDGLPIATGVIEGACRWLIRDRMNITGARWGLETAEAVLEARALVKNGDLEAYWRYHEGAEQHRNYRTEYADEEIPPLDYPGHSSKLRSYDLVA